MGVTDTTSEDGDSCTKITLETFREIFRNIEPEVQIDAFEEEQGSGRGDNYTATLYRTHLSGQRKSTTDGKKQKWEKNLICKRLPEDVQRREAYKSDKLFRNEVLFYTEILPELLRFQCTKTEKAFEATPKCFYARGDLLIMEDLRVRGFQMTDRQKGLTLDETRLVLKQVAQFHALSLAYKFEKPAQFERLRALVTEGLFCSSNENWYKNYYERLTKDAIKMVSDVLPDESKYLDAMRKFAGCSSFFSQMVYLVSTESALSAICHGDCWVNNFLYRYECVDDITEQKNAVEVCLVDFQLIRYSSIALDIANLLFCCTTKAMRDEHLNAFIKLYTSEVFSWLKTLCTHIPESCDSADKFAKLFREELKTYGRFALGLALDILPMSTCASEHAPDMYLNIHHDEMETGAPILNFPPNDLCRRKMTDIVIDMVDRGML
ncbi:PREDICTED: uncharacterized protein LOC108378927 isoform X1 [Rhagoletis zephyria]|uniref:uncharacterized protein LOC108378927 isoform X1 n=1 Tax=Rhagoletis zephyria TaxID=28612 RepID=UPI0008118D69|nr:PREDICTED: uncharacterized protein LOC108378927 isoform X1 [Rhagoletis zephyria]XP_036322732.1 uncharacterized protein LOC118736799 isoform X1 [Rhagoletis pomonella]